MLELWVWITLFAVVVQVGRHTLQKYLTATMKPMAVVWVRFLFGLPFGLLYFGVLLFVLDADLPPAGPVFWLYCVAASVMQVMGTYWLMLLFGERNFAVGITYTKTEIIQATVLGLVVVGDVMPPIGVAAMVFSVVGLMVLSAKDGRFDTRSLVTGIATKAAVLGIGSGLGFASASVFIRAAALELPDNGFLLRAGFVLVVVMSMQTAMIAVYFLIHDRNEIFNVLRQWRMSLAVGFTSALGSVGWFNAMTLERVAYVKMVSQMEVIGSLLVSYIVFKERSRPNELIGMAMVIGAIVVLLAFA